MAILESVRTRRLQFECTITTVTESKRAACEIRAHARGADEGRASVLLLARFFEGDPNPPFRLEISVEGMFRLGEGETAKDLVKGAGPATLYPYLRDEVAHITLRAGLPPVIMPSLHLAPPVQIREDVN